MLLEAAQFKFRTYAIIAIILYVVSVIGNLVIYYIGRATGAFRDDYLIQSPNGEAPLNEMSVIFATLTFLLLGYIGFFVLVKLGLPMARIRIIAAIVVVLTFVTPLTLVDPPSLMPIFLELMHIYTGIVVISGLTQDTLWKRFES